MATEPANQNDPRPFDGLVDGHESYFDAIAAQRLQLLVAGAFVTYLQALDLRPGVTVSQHVAAELVRQVPGILDAVRAR